MSTLLKPLSVREKLIQENLSVFSQTDLTRFFDASPIQIKHFLEEQTKSGFLKRLRRGLYALKLDMPAQAVIANRLYSPSYLSFEYALAYHHIIVEMPYEVTSATTKPTRTFIVNGITYRYFTLKKTTYTGYRLDKQVDGNQILLAEPEKALADYLYFVALGKRAPLDRLDTSRLDQDRLLAYAQTFENPTVINLINKYAI